MLRYLTIYLRIFLGSLLLSLPITVAVGIPSIGLVILIFIPVTGDPAMVKVVRDIAFLLGIAILLLMMAFSNVWVAITLGNAHIAAVKKSGFANVAGAFHVRQRRLITLTIPYDEAFVLCLSSLKAINNSQVIRHDCSTGIIQAKVRVSWKTWGNKISFRLLSQSNDEVVIEISSKPILPTTFVDYGENLSNVEHLIGFIKRNSKQENGSLLSSM